MKIYFCANPAAPEKSRQYFLRIKKFFLNAGVLLSDNLQVDELTNSISQEMERAVASGELLLTKFDGLVVFGNQPAGESGYLIALALAYKKPILYLLEKGSQLDTHIKGLLNDKQISKLLRIVFFSDRGLEKNLGEFIGGIEGSESGELPTIKFTLRITTAIERYLHWKTHNTKLSKADFLRQQIERLMDDDTDYQKYLLRREE